MTIHFGDIKTNTTLYIPFMSYDSSGASVTLTDLAVTDIEVYKDGGTTQRASDSGYTLLDTDGIDFDGVTGLHGISIDLSDDTDVGFYEAASQYWAVVSTVTIDGQAVTALIGTFTLSGNVLDDISAQVGNIAVGTAAISAVASSQILTTGTEVNDYTATADPDGVEHEISDVGGVIEMYYEFKLGGNGVAARMDMVGRLLGINDLIGVYAWDWSGASWAQIGEMPGQVSSENVPAGFNLDTRHTGTGINAGTVRVRGHATGLTSATLYIDHAYVSYAVVSQSVGYALGAIWLNSNRTNEGTEDYFDGTADNPVSTWAAFLTLSASLGIKRVVLISGSSVILTGNSDALTVTGYGASVNLNGRSVSGAELIGLDVTGNDSGTNAIPTIYRQCGINSSTLGLHKLYQCHRTGNITLAEGGDYIHDFCSSFVAAGETPDVTFPASATAYYNNRHYSGGERINGMKAGDRMSLEGNGQFKIAANCSGGEVAIRGNFGPLTDLSGGAVTVVQIARVANDTVADAVWDELQSGHVLNGSYGKGFKQMVEAYVSAEGSVNDAGATAVSFVTDLTDTTDSFYSEQLLVFTNGSLAGQSRPISFYDGTIKMAIFDEAYSGPPADGDTFIILTSHVHSLTKIADAILKRDFSSVSGEASRSMLNALRFLRNAWDTSSGSLVVPKEDDVTVAWTAALSSDPSAEPITGIDPT